MDGSPERLLARIGQDYRDGRLIPFLGAGFSFPLRLPSWDALIEIMGDQLGFESSLFRLHGDSPQLAQYYAHEMRSTVSISGLEAFIKHMNRTFHSEEVRERREKSIQHQALGRVRWRTIYTTNYEHHIEEALEAAGHKVVRLIQVGDFIRPYDPNACGVVKFHGDLDVPCTLVLTEEQYFDRFGLETAVDQRLRSDLLSHSFLFIGYSFRDTNIRYIWYRMKRMLDEYQKQNPAAEYQPRRSYFVSFGATPVQVRLLEAWNIDVLVLDPLDPSKAVADLFDEIGH